MKNNRLFVGNCDYSVDDTALTEFFESNGFPVATAQIIRDRVSDRSKGFGFVELKEAGDLDRAIETLNGKELGGRALTINIARERVTRPPSMRFDQGSGHRRGGGGGGRKERGGKRW